MRRSDQRRDAVFACYQHDVTGRPLSELTEDAKPFTLELVDGVNENRTLLDEVIGRNATGWTTDRIAPLDKNILRIALFEIGYRDDVPIEVSIDEAIELAKRYCGVDAPGFIHGIIGAVVREMPPKAATGGGTGE